MKHYISLFESEISSSLTIKELQQLSDDEILLLLAKYPYERQWKNKDAYNWIQYWIAHRQGKVYSQTGKAKKAFRKLKKY